MTIAEQILQLKKDFDDVFAAGYSQGQIPVRRITLRGTTSGAEVLDLQIVDNTIYEIYDYEQINITAPGGNYSSYLYINLPNRNGVSITLPSHINKAGDNPSTAKSGEKWEISMDSGLGALSLNTNRYKYE